jgi:hypothetical protein
MPIHAGRIRVKAIDSDTPDLATQSVQSVQPNPSVHRTGLLAAHNTSAPIKQHEQKKSIAQTQQASNQSVDPPASFDPIQYLSYMSIHAGRIRVGTIDSSTPDLATQSVQSVQSNPSVHRKGLLAAHNTSTPAKCESVPSIRISLLKSGSPSKPHLSHPSQMNEQFSSAPCYALGHPKSRILALENSEILSRRNF